MPRRPRIYIPGISVHVIQRGDNGAAIVGGRADYRRLLALLKEATTHHGVDVHGFVIMTTHYHLLVTPQHENALPRAMKDVNGQYAQYFNRKYGRMGTMWNGPYRALSISDDMYLLTCLRYIEQNPVRAGMVTAPDAYAWSSYRVNGMGEYDDWLVQHDVYKRLGSCPAERIAAYRTICGIPVTEGELKELRQRSGASQRSEVRPQTVCDPGVLPHNLPNPAHSG
jgi:putative transposase